MDYLTSLPTVEVPALLLLIVAGFALVFVVLSILRAWVDLNETPERVHHSRRAADRVASEREQREASPMLRRLRDLS